MPLIGKALRISNVFKFAFTLTISGTDYTFDDKSASSSVSEVYAFTRGDKSWSLVVYANGTLTFTKLGHMVDYCAVGGGGGSGGSRAGGYGDRGWGYYSGAGGGGKYAEQMSKTMSVNKAYTISLGGGGSGGLGGSDSGTSGSGSGGSATTLVKDNETILSASGGNGGGGASSGGSGAAGGGGANKHCFEDNTLPLVGVDGSTSYRGGGGSAKEYHMDYYNSWWGLDGNSGAMGLFCIRSTPKE